jgi:membrane associated rhomboid family serine protease
VLASGGVAHVPALIVLGGWILLQIISQVSVVPGTGGVAYMAHIGGFIAGMILIFLFGRGRAAGQPSAPGRLARTFRS